MVGGGGNKEWRGSAGSGDHGGPPHLAQPDKGARAAWVRPPAQGKLRVHGRQASSSLGALMHPHAHVLGRRVSKRALRVGGCDSDLLSLIEM